MRQLRMLVWREWRENRQLAIGAAVLSVVVSVFVQHFRYFYDVGSAARELIPVMAMVFVTFVASDLFSVELRSRRLETMALLPVSPVRLWLGKMLFLLSFGVAVYAWSFGVNALLAVAGFDPDFARGGFQPRGEAWVPVAQGSVLVAAVLLYSTLGVRSFVAVLLGAGTAWFFGALLQLLGVERALGLRSAMSRVESGAIALAILSVPFGLAAAVAFIRGRLQTGSRRRAVVVGLTVAGSILLPSVAWGVTNLVERLSLEPGDPIVHVGAVHASPDGRHVALQVQRGEEGQSRVWVIRLDGGRLFTWGRPGMRLEGFASDGGIRMWGRPIVDRIRKRGAIETIVDPETGHMLRAVVAGISPQMASPARWPRWASFPGPMRDAYQRLRAERSSKDAGLNSPIPLRRPGQVVVVGGNGGIVSHDLKAGTERNLADLDCEIRRVIALVSPTGRYVSLGVAGAERGIQVLVDVERGAVVDLADLEGRQPLTWALSPAAVDYLVVTGPPDRTNAWAVFDVERGRLIELPLPAGHGGWDAVEPLADGSMIVSTGSEVLWIERDGSVRKRLYGPRGD